MVKFDLTPEEFAEFKLLYLKALHTNKESFLFKETQFYTAFAKSIIKNYNYRYKKE